jgi:hypothetical protein
MFQIYHSTEYEVKCENQVMNEQWFNETMCKFFSSFFQDFIVFFMLLEIFMLFLKLTTHVNN